MLFIYAIVLVVSVPEMFKFKNQDVHILDKEK